MKETVRKFVVAVLLIAAGAGFAPEGHAGQAAPTLAPVNPRFLKAPASAGKSVLLSVIPEGGERSLGYLPSPIDYSYLKGQRIGPEVSSKRTMLPAVLPASYDLRLQNKLAPVRNQGVCGACWAFSAVGAVESVLLPAEPRHFSENNLKNTSGFDYDHCNGGNGDMAVAYFARWGGPVNDSDDPYSENSGISPAGLPVQKHIQDAVIIPPRTGPLDNDQIKQAVMDYGGVMSALYVDDGIRNSVLSSAFNPTNNAYNFTGTADTNHIIVIVGWDDNYDKGQFSTQPSGNGAFIARNSWGSGFGEGGYFYISYYDNDIGSENHQFRSLSLPFNFSRIYQYDPLGKTDSIGYDKSETAWFANIFSAQADERISAVSFYTPVVNSGYELYVYSGVSDGRPTSGTLASSQSDTIAAPGYHTLTLNLSVPVTTGERFSIVVKLTTPGYASPISVELPRQGYSSGAVASAGESFISADGTGASWSDLTSYTYYSNTNVCLKAFADNPSYDTDTGPPVVSAFTVANSSTLTVPVQTFEARDDQQLNGYLITESADIPSWFSPAWSAGQPTSYLASAEGVKTLFGWSRDAVGNVSAGKQAQVIIDANQVVTVMSFSATANHTAVVKSDGSLWCWGANSSGQLGDGTTADKNVPQRIGSAGDWKEVATGAYHTLAVKTDGSLWAWGNNQYGQLGNGTTSVYAGTAPIRIGSENSWLHVSAGGFHSLAVKSDGSLWSWGLNNRGQLGINSTVDADSPQQIGAGLNWNQISAGYDHSAALQADRSLWTWGGNTRGQLGHDGSTNRPVPGAVDGTSGWRKVAAGFAFTLGIKVDGTLWAWGSDHDGALGNGVTDDYLHTPSAVSPDTDWSDVAAGYHHGAALKTDGSLWTWGYNSSGQLGDGGTTARYVPTRVGAANDWRVISAGESYSTALKNNGSLWSWGANAKGELGNGGAGVPGSGGVQLSTPALIFVTAPTVTDFQIPAASSTLSVAITTFKAVDDVAVTSYCVSESASPSGCNWSGTVQSGYRFATAGAKTLYAYAMDAAGNISVPASAGVSVAGAGIPGDCGGSGIVSVFDAEQAINMFLGLKPILGCADLNGDGKASISELQTVINSFLGL